MSIQEDLALFYDDQAVKYAQTREKYRAEADLFLEEIALFPDKKIRILEFGCGSGRLLSQLTQIKDKKISYIGVDLSQKLLDIAKKYIPKTNKTLSCTFVCADILQYIWTCKQESFDFVIGIASFQHMPRQKDRYYLLKNSYRVLSYEWKLLMSNWSFSRWFLQKYQSALIQSIWKSILYRGKKKWNDLQLPWKTKGKTFLRFYHIFTQKELTHLVRLSGFILLKSAYIDSHGNKTSDWKNSRSTFVVGQKSVFSPWEIE